MARLVVLIFFLHYENAEERHLSLLVTIYSSSQCQRFAFLFNLASHALDIAKGIHGRLWSLLTVDLEDLRSSPASANRFQVNLSSCCKYSASLLCNHCIFTNNVGACFNGNIKLRRNIQQVLKSKQLSRCMNERNFCIFTASKKILFSRTIFQKHRGITAEVAKHERF